MPYIHVFKLFGKDEDFKALFRYYESEFEPEFDKVVIDGPNKVVFNHVKTMNCFSEDYYAAFLYLVLDGDCVRTFSTMQELTDFINKYDAN